MIQYYKNKDGDKKMGKPEDAEIFANIGYYPVEAKKKPGRPKKVKEDAIQEGVEE